MIHFSAEWQVSWLLPGSASSRGHTSVTLGALHAEGNYSGGYRSGLAPDSLSTLPPVLPLGGDWRVRVSPFAPQSYNKFPDAARKTGKFIANHRDSPIIYAGNPFLGTQTFRTFAAYRHKKRSIMKPHYTLFWAILIACGSIFTSCIEIIEDTNRSMALTGENYPKFTIHKIHTFLVTC